MASRPPVSLNFIERAIAELSPKWGFKRMRQKSALALAGGYHGASRSRTALRNWTPGASDPAADILPDLAELRGRCRDLARNSPVAGGALNTMVSNVVGTGLSMQSRIDADFLGLDEAATDAWQANAERRFTLWCESENCDTTRTQNFYGLQALAFRSACESGDCLGLTPAIARPNWPFRLTVQLIEADRVCNPDHKQDTDGLMGGIELDGMGAPVAAHIARVHPGALRARAKQKWDRYPFFGEKTGRRNVLHLMDRKRPGQVRGVPILAAIIEPLKQLTRYTEAELQAAVVSGAFAVFLRMDPEAFKELFENETDQAAYLSGAKKWDGSVGNATLEGPGKAVNLLPGEDPVSVNPGRPNAEFDPFVMSILRQVGMEIGIPFEVLIKHFSSSFSASKAALQDFFRFVLNRRDWLATYFCKPIYELWLDEEVASGRIAAPGYFADPMIRKAYAMSEWVGDGPISIDAVKEVTAAKMRVEMGISTLAAESVLHDGKDWLFKHRQRSKEARMRREAGLTEAVSAPQAPDPSQGDPNNPDSALNLDTAPETMAP